MTPKKIKEYTVDVTYETKFRVSRKLRPKQSWVLEDGTSKKEWMVLRVVRVKQSGVCGERCESVRSECQPLKQE